MSKCNNCQSKGLGDTVSKVIKKVSGGRIKECGGCAKRRDWLNEKISYRNNALDAINKIQNMGTQ
mgnify:FL=1|jgi:hypothetical protein|tara:strand:- start:471 stop:665 length:195 start_codon:yes stop_codon:yes gene_type:complete